MILCICPNPSVDMFAWIDDFRSGEVNRVTREARFPGGKGVHVAMAVAELKEPVALLGCWGGATGAWIRAACEQQGVRCYGPEVEGWSRTCMTFKSDNEAVRDTELLGTGPVMDSDDFSRLIDAYREVLSSATLVCMSGSWPVGAPADGYAELLRIAHAAGKFTLLDTTGAQLPPALAERPGVVHMNRSEARSFFGGADVGDNARRLVDDCTYAAVTAGAEGLYLARGNVTVHAKCTVENVYSAVGSGDCLLAGMAVALYRKLSLEDVARWGVACGAANCVREELGMLYRADVEIFLKRAELSRLSDNP